ncbi:hypothetical protein PX554_18090 [Sphingomonas sp. H39-1-10]|uniref:hypothetical protein n=1 Tax=Sphingomonas pollutisoli TaxID=3030829 RepID=UPI0023B986F5|nr:hypothetical protein [Sphingomonas pollutisoli]MDF0490048.1 hypothetical protein [Sphingomonas pollutisoli]
MMFRFAAVRPDGSIARTVTASSEAVIDLNMPADTTKIEAPEAADAQDTPRVGMHTYDFSTGTFRRVNGADEGQA